MVVDYFSNVCTDVRIRKYKSLQYSLFIFNVERLTFAELLISRERRE